MSYQEPTRYGTYTSKKDGTQVSAHDSDAKALMYWQMGDFFEAYVNKMLTDYDFETSFNVPYKGPVDFIFDYFLAGPSPPLIYTDPRPPRLVFDWELHWKLFILPQLQDYDNVPKFVSILQKDLYLSSDQKSYIMEVLYRYGNMALFGAMNKLGIRPVAQSVREAYYGPMFKVFVKLTNKWLVKDLQDLVFYFLF